MAGPAQIDDDATVMAAFVETRDRKKFEVLFQRHKRAMVAYAGRYVRSTARAEELAQEIFVRVYTTKRYEPGATFKSWLYRVATNVCLNELRRSEHRQVLESLEGRDGEGGALTRVADGGASPEQQLAERQLARGLEAALASLPEKQRAAFVMARFEAMSHEDIAGALSTTIPAVKSLIHRALETMRAKATALLSEGGEEREVAS
ncbi:MAG: sigma-70 family RNA polymerase sigma factor [Deltaproteobacteria bacterium]|nr:sigma-70 family RNA polymerase sigma factor [Deltaproteobacteria bacterium]